MKLPPDMQAEQDQTLGRQASVRFQAAMDRLFQWEDAPPIGALLPIPIVLPAEGLGGAALALLEWARANPDEARKLRAANEKAWASCPACGFKSPFIPCQRCGTEIPIEEAK